MPGLGRQFSLRTASFLSTTMQIRGRKRAREASVSQEQAPEEISGAEPTRADQHDNVPPKDKSTRSASTKRLRQAQTKGKTLAPVDNADATDGATSQLAAPSNIQPEGRATRAQNKFCRLALDVGLDWKEAQRERVATEATKASKKAENERKKAETTERTQLCTSGMARIAHLEEAREQRDREEEEYVNAGGRHLASSKARSTQTVRGGTQEGQSVGSGSEFGDDVAEVTSTTSESSGVDEEVGKTPKPPNISKSAY
ncbi:hypothetical protein LXA43DRAFT_1064775 [Ganoderma leucocontextum]|nr:hypothetical protein LXA43DRAFT_1064775 [Ganoderma leucocontextum]